MPSDDRFSLYGAETTRRICIGNDASEVSDASDATPGPRGQAVLGSDAFSDSSCASPHASEQSSGLDFLECPCALCANTPEIDWRTLEDRR